MRLRIATLLVSLLLNGIHVTSKELAAIVTYTVSPAEGLLARKGSTRAAIESASLPSERIEVQIHPTRTRSDAGRSRRTDDVTVAAPFERERSDGDSEENVRILQNYAVTNFNNNLSTTRSTTESVIELLDRLRNLPPEESGGHLEALGSGSESADPADNTLQLLNEWREDVRVTVGGGQTNESTTSTLMEDKTTTPSLPTGVMKPVTTTQETYIITEGSNNPGNNEGVFTTDIFTTTTITTTSITANTKTTASTAVTPTINNFGSGDASSQATITTAKTSSAEENIPSSTTSIVIGTTTFEKTTSLDMLELYTTPLPTTSANTNGNILIPNVPLVAVGGGVIKDSDSAGDKEDSGAAFWDSRVEIAVVSAAAVLLCLVAAAALITYCVCRNHFHRKNIYTTMEVEPRPQFFTKPGPPVILRHEVEERRAIPQSHAPNFGERERQKVTEL